jgi:hypothetical protein
MAGNLFTRLLRQPRHLKLLFMLAALHQATAHKIALLLFMAAQPADL